MNAHVQSHIATKYNLDEKGEDVLLIGHIISDIYFNSYPTSSTGLINASERSKRSYKIF